MPVYDYEWSEESSDNKVWTNNKKSKKKDKVWKANRKLKNQTQEKTRKSERIEQMLEK